VRTIFRLCLVAAVIAAFGLVAVPVASANVGPTGHASITNFEKKQNKRIKKAKNKAAKAHERIEAIKDWNFTQDDRLGATEDLLGQIVAVAVPLVSAIQNQIVPGLEAINTALEDPTTGLVGLNLARPQFGVFAGNGDFLGGTGTVASGPDDDAFRAGAGTYVVDFNNNVASRVYTVTVAPTGGASLAPSAVNCVPGSAASASIEAACDAAAGNTNDHPERVFVLLQNTNTFAPTDGTFTVTAIHG